MLNGPLRTRDLLRPSGAATDHQKRTYANSIGSTSPYDPIDPEECDEVEKGDEDFQYTWQNFLDVRRFYKKAAAAKRAVIFTVD